MASPKVRYTARRSLKSGVSNGTIVTYDLPLRAGGFERRRQPYVYSRRSIGGVRETYRYNAESVWNFTLVPLTSAQAQDIVQFLDSVEDGQRFQMDPAGGTSYRYVTIESQGYTETRDPMDDSLFHYSFSIVETT